MHLAALSSAVGVAFVQCSMLPCMYCCIHPPPRNPCRPCLLLADSCLKGRTLGSGSGSSRSDLAADLRSVSAHITADLARHQQQTTSLNSQLSCCQGIVQQLQQQLTHAEVQGQELRDCLAAAEASKVTAVQAAVAQTEARYGRKLVRVEAKVLGMVRGQGLAGAEICSAWVSLCFLCGGTALNLGAAVGCSNSILLSCLQVCCCLACAGMIIDTQEA